MRHASAAVLLAGDIAVRISPLTRRSSGRSADLQWFSAHVTVSQIVVWASSVRPAFARVSASAALNTLR